MDEYISKQAFKDKYLCCGYLPEMSETEFDTFPAADVVEVIRCRECKSYDHGCCVVKRYRGDDSIITMPPDGYCSYGQRKEADHD